MLIDSSNFSRLKINDVGRLVFRVASVLIYSSGFAQLISIASREEKGRLQLEIDAVGQPSKQLTCQHI